MTRRKPLNPNADPWPYKGDLRRADGVAPFNHHLWPMEDAFHPGELRPYVCGSRYYWYVIPLNNGAWLADGYVLSKQYPTREVAMRAAAARVLRTARAARHWDGMDHMDAEQLRVLVAWVYDILKRPAPSVYIAPPPPPPAPTTLLEIMEAP
jgi:hypothetical protein